MILIIKSIIGGWPEKFQDIVFKSTKSSDKFYGQDRSTR